MNVQIHSSIKTFDKKVISGILYKLEKGECVMGKKCTKLISGVILLFALVACTQSTEKDIKSEEIDQVSIKDQPIKEDSDNTTPPEENTMDSASETADRDDIDNDSKDIFTEYTEGAAITQEINIDGLTPDIQTNNDYKRIMLLTSDNKEVRYKTIYLKKKKTLKIIDIKNDNGQIFYGTI